MTRGVPENGENSGLEVRIDRLERKVNALIVIVVIGALCMLGVAFSSSL
jgi:hypothetical protein